MPGWYMPVGGMVLKLVTTVTPRTSPFMVETNLLLSCSGCTVQSCAAKALPDTRAKRTNKSQSFRMGLSVVNIRR